MFGRNKKTNATKTENCSNCGSSRTTKDSACKRSCSKSSSKRSSKN